MQHYKAQLKEREKERESAHRVSTMRKVFLLSINKQLQSSLQRTRAASSESSSNAVTSPVQSLASSPVSSPTSRKESLESETDWEELQREVQEQLSAAVREIDTLRAQLQDSQSRHRQHLDKEKALKLELSVDKQHALDSQRLQLESFFQSQLADLETQLQVLSSYLL
jgi:hypothetical protein